MSADEHATDALTVNYSEDGVIKVRELERVVLSQSSTWATLAFLFDERDPATGEFSAPKVTLRRYRKKAGRFVIDKHFVLASGRQNHALSDALLAWLPRLVTAQGAEPDDG